MINLSSDQRRQIVQAACTLTPAARSAFIADIESTLAQHCLGRAASNTDVQRAINCVLDTVAWPKSNSVFMCDSKQQATFNFNNEEATTMSNFDRSMAARVRNERARSELEDNAVENGILQDGHSLIVPLFMADGNINPTLTFAQRLMAEKVQKAAMDAAASTSTTGGPTMTTRNYTLADAERFGLKDASALSRPGFRYNGADPYAKDQAIIAYADRDLEYAEAWKTKPPLPYSTELTGEGSRGPYDKTGMGREFDSCMTNTGERGRKIDIGGKLVCVPLEIAEEYMREAAETDTTSAQAELSARDAARIDYENALCNAWRNPTGSVSVSDSVVPASAPQRLDLTKDVQRPDLTKDVATIQKEHSVRMQALYNRIDQEISEAYKAR